MKKDLGFVIGLSILCMTFFTDDVNFNVKKTVTGVAKILMS
jgi:hypothetical protein